MEQTSAEDAISYWDAYYLTSDIPRIPSQFAVFAHGELPDARCVIDVGCGNGRDSLYFARHRLHTIGVDSSSSAIAVCERLRGNGGYEHLRFLKSSVRSPNLPAVVEAAMPGAADAAPLLIYARFFLHAIDEADEAALLGHAATLLSKWPGVLALEFRTDRDREQQKVTPHHYRRFIRPHDFLIRARNAGFDPSYYVDGFGLAKFKSDDAHVARVLLRVAE